MLMSCSLLFLNKKKKGVDMRQAEITRWLRLSNENKIFIRKELKRLRENGKRNVKIRHRHSGITRMVQLVGDSKLKYRTTHDYEFVYGDAMSVVDEFSKMTSGVKSPYSHYHDIYFHAPVGFTNGSQFRGY